MDTLYRQVTQDYRYFGKNVGGIWLKTNNLEQVASKDPVFEKAYNNLIYYVTFCEFPLQKVLLYIQKFLSKSEFDTYKEYDHFRMVATLCFLYCIERCLVAASNSHSSLGDEEPIDMSNVIFSGSKIIFSVGLIDDDYTEYTPHIRSGLKKIVSDLKRLGFDILLKENSGYYVFTLSLRSFDDYKERVERRLELDDEYNSGMRKPFNFDDPLAGLEKAY